MCRGPALQKSDIQIDGVLLAATTIVGEVVTFWLATTGGLVSRGCGIETRRRTQYSAQELQAAGVICWGALAGGVHGWSRQQLFLAGR